MQPDVAARLARLNADFYDQHGLAFAETRPRLNPGVRRVLHRIPPEAHVLDVGCGDGKPGRWLSDPNDRPAVSERLPVSVGHSDRYVGLDASPSMIARARALTGARAGVRFAQVDVAEGGWAAPYAEAFDWVLAFAMLHHVPGAGGRARVVRDLAACCRPDGRVALSCWRPSRSARLLGRMADWGEIGLNAGDVERGDLLIGWERAGQRGWRYVHEFAPAELDALAMGAGLRLCDRFISDGHAGDLADYAIFER